MDTVKLNGLPPGPKGKLMEGSPSLRPFQNWSTAGISVELFLGDGILCASSVIVNDFRRVAGFCFAWPWSIQYFDQSTSFVANEESEERERSRSGCIGSLSA